MKCRGHVFLLNTAQRQTGSSPNSKHWFTTSLLGGRCLKAQLGVRFKPSGPHHIWSSSQDTVPSIAMICVFSKHLLGVVAAHEDENANARTTVLAEVSLYVHRNLKLTGGGSPGRPPRLSHGS